MKYKQLYLVFLIIVCVNGILQAQKCRFTIGDVFNVYPINQGEGFVYQKKLTISGTSFTECYPYFSKKNIPSDQQQDSCFLTPSTIQSISYLHLSNNKGYVPEICENLSNITDIEVRNHYGFHKTISRLKNLKRIIVSSSHNIKGIENLKSKTLTLFSTRLGSLHGKQLAVLCNQNPNLETIAVMDDSIKSHKLLNNESINALKKLAKLHNLSMDLTNADSCFVSVFECANLTHLSLHNANFDNYTKSEGIIRQQSISNLTGLKSLTINGFKIKNSLAVLPFMQNLEYLEIDLSDYTDEEILKTLKHLPKLQCVSINLGEKNAHSQELLDFLNLKNCSCW